MVDQALGRERPERAATGGSPSRIALGTVQFGTRYGVANAGDQVSKEDAAAILAYASSCGLDTLDTAIAYGESEQRLGEIGVARWKVVTKLPRAPEGCRDIRMWVRDEVRTAMERLRVTRFYGLLLHHPLDLVGSHGRAMYHAMRELRDAGAVEKIGISVYGPDELDTLSSRFSFDLVQAPLNVVDRRLLTSGWLQRLHGAGTEVHIRSIFLQGLLLMDASRRPATFDRWSELWSRWDRWLAEQQLSSLQACVAFALSHSQVSRIVVGVDSLWHLREIIDASATRVIVPPQALMSDEAELINPSCWNSL